MGHTTPSAEYKGDIPYEWIQASNIVNANANARVHAQANLAKTGSARVSNSYNAASMR